MYLRTAKYYQDISKEPAKKHWSQGPLKSEDRWKNWLRVAKIEVIVVINHVNETSEVITKEEMTELALLARPSTFLKFTTLAKELYRRASVDVDVHGVYKLAFNQSIEKIEKSIDTEDYLNYLADELMYGSTDSPL